MNRVDEKGKTYTQRVTKMGTEVEILTVRGTIHGYLHLSLGQRVKDLLNNNEQFLAITSALVKATGQGSPTGSGDAREVGFMALNKQHIISVIPINEPKQPVDDESYP
jgi:hypothetical protein